MNNLDTLADQIYQEGIEKANQESAKIIEAARQQAQAILDDAGMQADNILNEAHTKASQLESRTRNEIQVKARQALSDLRVDIEKILLSTSLEEPVATLFKDNKFLKELILTITNNWATGHGDTVTLPEEMINDIQEYLSGTSQKDLNELVLNPSAQMSNGFTVEKTEKGYYLSFTDEDFIAFLKPYFTEQLQQILFD